VFGSTLKGTARPDSDLDLLVEFEPHAKPGLIGMARIEIELSSLLNGRKVDLRAPTISAVTSATRSCEQSRPNMRRDDAIEARLSR
jgi:predicted nucleotidyltransferase